MILTLEGKSKLNWNRGDHRADVSADRIKLNLTIGQIESEMIPSPPANVSPVQPSAPSPVVPQPPGSRTTSPSPVP